MLQTNILWRADAVMFMCPAEKRHRGR
jgi:hypothetical protein